MLSWPITFCARGGEGCGLRSLLRHGDGLNYFKGAERVENFICEG